MFYKQEKSGYAQAVAGVRMKTLVHGEKTLLTEFRLTAGHTLPMHAHEHEQAGYLISGAISLTIACRISFMANWAERRSSGQTPI